MYHHGTIAANYGGPGKLEAGVAEAGLNSSGCQYTINKGDMY